jgi:Lar family restriction alleviation protein
MITWLKRAPSARNCPFCGAPPIQLEVQPTASDDYYSIHCMKCDAWGPEAEGIDAAILLWNRRRRK